MSYTQRAKSEIMENRSLRSRFKNQQGYGLLLFGRTYGPGSITLATRQREVARYYAAAITRAVKLTGTITTREEASGGQSAFQVRVDAPSDRRALLNHYAMLYPEGITYELLGGDEGAAAFVGGAFLACGSLADPEKKYHLEFAPPRPETAAVLTGILGEVGFLHSTGKNGSDGVVINSFDPAAPDYREDLAQGILSMGSIFNV